MSASVAAVYDIYFISSELSQREGGVSRAEIHSISYLACLLGVYDGLPVDAWRYEFASTKAGAPYAGAIDQALVLLQATGAITESSGLFSLTERGRSIFRGIRRLPSLSGRERYLDPACSVSLALSLPTVTEAVTNEPQLRVAMSLGQSRRLLDQPGVVVVDEHFRGLRSVLGTDSGQPSHLFTAAIVWLTYLSQQSQAAEVINAG